MKTFKQFNEVAPPGFGHTKSDKDKGVKKGGTAAAFDRARKRGDFKGSKSDMFAIMWSQKNKGDKPHYKPGTDEKYKKYQEDWKPEIEVIDTKKRKKEAEKKRKEAEASLPPHLKLDVMKKAFSEEPERTPEYKAMQRKLYPRGESEKVEWRNPKNRGRKRKVMAEFEPELEMVDAEVVLEREDSPYEKASDKALDKKYGYGTSHDKGSKTGFGRASNRNTAAAVLKDIRRRKSKSTSETRADAAHKGWSATAKTSKEQTPEKKATRKKLADTPYKKLPKDEQEKDQVAADAVKKEYDKKKKKKVNEGSAYGLWKGDGKRKLPGDKDKAWNKIRKDRGDQKEFERAQAYIKKNPNFGKVSEAKVDKGRSDYGKATIRNWRHSGPSTVEPAMFDPENKRGKTIDKRREEHKARRGVKGAKVPTYKKESFSDWRIDLGEEGYDRWRDDRLVKYGIGHDGSDRKGPSPRPTGKQPKGDTVYQAKMRKKYGGKLPSAIQVVKDKYKGQIYDGKKKG